MSSVKAVPSITRVGANQPDLNFRSRTIGSNKTVANDWPKVKLRRN